MIGLTGDDIVSNPGIAEEAKNAGMNEVITKPVDLGKLTEVMNNID